MVWLQSLYLNHYDKLPFFQNPKHFVVMFILLIQQISIMGQALFELLEIQLKNNIDKLSALMELRMLSEKCRYEI